MYSIFLETKSCTKEILFFIFNLLFHTESLPFWLYYQILGHPVCYELRRVKKKSDRFNLICTFYPSCGFQKFFSFIWSAVKFFSKFAIRTFDFYYSLVIEIDRWREFKWIREARSLMFLSRIMHGWSRLSSYTHVNTVTSSDWYNHRCRRRRELYVIFITLTAGTLCVLSTLVSSLGILNL